MRAIFFLICVSLLAGSSAADQDLLGSGFAGARAGEGGLAFAFDLGSERVNWNNARWARAELGAASDWSAHAGLRLVVRSPDLRRDVGVAVALQEADGSWHYHAWACELSAARNEAVIRFADFRPALWLAPNVHGMPADHLDENQAFDPEAVTGIAIGAIDPRGAGRVAFTVETLALHGTPAIPGEVLVAVSGRTLEVNGSAMMPGGLFGHFPGGGTREMRMGSHREIFADYIGGGGQPAKPQCTDPAIAVLLDVEGGDRYQASMRLTDANWEEHCRSRGASFGRKLAAYAAEHDRQVVAEWWNEPYLNWSNRSRKNFEQKFFDESRAVEGGPVHLTVDGSEAPHLCWTKDYDAPPWQWLRREEWRAGRDAKGKVWRGGAYAPPEGVADGETYRKPVTKKVKDPETGKKVEVADGEVELTAFTPWYVYDETQFTFWSGKAQLRHYVEPMLAFGEGLKAANPEAPYAVGWDFRPSEDYWAAWEMLYQPTIDAGIAVIDGVTDHDYGGDVTRMPANYEFVTAYGMARHGKWLLNYNTECGENSDPSANPAAAASMQQAGKKWLKAMWSARKTVHAAATVPDKARSFTFHWFDKGAEGVSFTALRTLRGRLVAVDCPDPDVFVAASIDGTDPLLPRPDYLSPGQELTIAVFNDHRDARQLRIPLRAPTGTTFATLIERRTRPDETAGTVELDEIEHAVNGAEHLWEGELPGKHLLVLSLPLDGSAPERAELRRRQFFADCFLQDVHAEAPATTTIAVPAELLDGIRDARLRLVVERLAEGEGMLRLNGTEIPLPAANTPVDGPWIRDVVIDPALLRADNELVFTAGAERAGWLLCSASLFLEHAVVD